MVNDSMDVDITPDRKLITKMGQASGYLLWQALSELVDNSVDARINELGGPIKISIQFDGSGGEFLYGTEGEYDLEISDNGKGMDFEEFSKCMKLAYVDEKKGDVKRLGYFGLGMKTASANLGSKFKVISKPYKGKEKYTLIFDEEDFIKNGSWDKFQIDRESDESDWHGTIIKIKKRSKLNVYKEKINRLKKNFGKQYTYLIQNNIIDLKINTGSVKSESIELEKDSEFAPDGKYYLDFLLTTGQKVTGWYGFRPVQARNTGVVSEQAFGFNIYWRQRLVGRYEKIGFPIHTTFHRLIGELNLDDFSVTHNKRELVKESPEYMALAGISQNEDSENPDHHESELWVHLKGAIDSFKRRNEERINLIKRTKDAAEEGIISLATYRTLKKKINSREIKSDTVNELIEQEAKLRQRSLSTFVDNSNLEIKGPEEDPNEGDIKNVFKVVSVNIDNNQLEINKKIFPMERVSENEDWVLRIKGKYGKIISINSENCKDELEKLFNF